MPTRWRRTSSGLKSCWLWYEQDEHKHKGQPIHRPFLNRPVVSCHQDAENEKKELPLKYQDEISEKLGEAEGLLKDLFLDVDKAKKLGHPQSSEIESE